MKRTILSILLIVALSFSCYAADQWAKDDPLGTRNVSDLDYYLGINNEATDRALSNYRTGAKVTYNSVSTITIAAGEVVCSKADGSVRKFRKNTSAINLTFAANLDTGSEATGTTYYVYAVADTDAETFTGIISANSATPQGGQTYYKRLGSFYNDASSNILNDESLTNDNNYYGLVLGDWVSKSAGTVYLASTDGFVSAYIVTSGAGSITGETDSATPPTTTVAYEGHTSSENEYHSISFPVKKGDYYKVSSGASAVYWIPNQ